MTTDTQRADSQTLINDYIEVTASIKALQDARGHIEMELTNRMRADEAVAIPHETHTVELVPSSLAWDYGKLAALREFLPPNEVARAYVPEHQETITVKEKWDMRHTRHFSKFGGVARTIIEGARLEGPRRLRIREKR
jgi:hypothetical protein